MPVSYENLRPVVSTIILSYSNFKMFKNPIANIVLTY